MTDRTPVRGPERFALPAPAARAALPPGKAVGAALALVGLLVGRPCSSGP